MLHYREIPLSFAQRQLWFLDQLAPGESGYNLLDGFRIRGLVDIDLLKFSLRSLTDRHESLRSSFIEVDGQPVQVIAEHTDVVISLFDVSGRPRQEREAEAKRISADEVKKPIQLNRAPLWRMSLIRIEEEECWVILTIHHIIFDGWSSSIFWNELVEIYQSALDRDAGAGRGRGAQLSDYVKWERDHLQGDRLEHLTNYWRRQLSGAPARLELPIDFSRPARPSHRGAKSSLALCSGLASHLRELAKQQHTTLFITLLAAYKVLLFRYTHQEDLVVGTPFACRVRSGHEGIIGFLVNTLVLRSRLSLELSFIEVMRNVRATSIAAYDHGDLPFCSLVEAIGPERDVSYNPLFQTMFQMNEQQAICAEQAGLKLEPLALESFAANFDLTLEVLDGPEHLVLRMEYATDLFRSDTIERFLRNYAFLLEQIISEPQQRIGNLQPMIPGERTQLLEVWSQSGSKLAENSDVSLSISIKGNAGQFTGEVALEGTGLSNGQIASALEQMVVQIRQSEATAKIVDSELKWAWQGGGMGYLGDESVQCLHRHFEDQAKRFPERLAVCHEGRSLTYEELNATANQLAYELIARGVKPDAPVGICLERSLDMIVALLAVLKSGGAYLPLDPGYPVDRLKFKLKDAGVHVLVSREELVKRLLIEAPSIVCMDRDRSYLARHSQNNPEVEISLSNLAYVIYTSGSTGKPKGVMIEHRAASHFVQAAIANYAVTSSDCVLQFGSISFDLAVEEIFTCLSAGGRLQLRNEEMLSTPARFFQCCEGWRVTILDLPTAYWHQLMSEMAHSACRLPASVRLVIIGGERVLPGMVKTWCRLVGDYPRLFNSYGPTETTVVATGHWIGGDSLARADVPIGRPLANAEVYVLDSAMQPVPMGVPGELYIGGRSVARGYLNRPELTARAFTVNPLQPGSRGRLYKSGDKVRFLHDGNLEFLGRMDNQVKIRGFRIELGEIESALLRFPGVRETIVVALPDGTGSQRLNAYLVPQSGQSVSVQGVKEFLKESLPAYMVPAGVITLPSLPLTPNGKVDVRALPSAIDFEDSESLSSAAETAPKTPVEEKLISIWSTVLNAPKIGIDDRFFDLGGHSLQAVQIMTRIRREFGVDLPLSALFQSPSVAEMSARLMKVGMGTSWSPLVPFQVLGAKLPFFAIHGGHGEVLFYKALSENLGGDQPFYALRAIGNDYPGMAHQSVGEMARCYVEAIRRVQPKGPYRIGGASFGGIVAFEMAQQLDAAGEEIDRLVLFDAGGFCEFTKPLPLATRCLNLLRYIPQYGIQETWHRLRVRLLRCFMSDSVVEFYRANGTLPQQSSEAITSWEAVWKANLAAADRYVPSEYAGEITLIRARDDGNYLWFDCHPDYGWGGYARGGIVGYDVPGTHIGMFQEPYVKELARTMAALLSVEGGSTLRKS